MHLSRPVVVTRCIHTKRRIYIVHAMTSSYESQKLLLSLSILRKNCFARLISDIIATLFLWDRLIIGQLEFSSTSKSSNPFYPREYRKNHDNSNREECSAVIIAPLHISEWNCKGIQRCPTFFLLKVLTWKYKSLFKIFSEVWEYPISMGAFLKKF